MDKWKRGLALAGVVVLLAAFLSPMFFAGGSGEGSQKRFMAAAAAAVLIPILVYICMMAVRVFGPKTKKAGQIRNVIFDVGNVLMDFAWEEYLDGFGFPQEKRERIADAVFRNPVWNERDRGDRSDEEYLLSFIQEAPEYEEDIREVVRRSPECIHLFPYSETWLHFLQERGLRTFILSNYSQYMLDHTKNDMKFLKYADGAVFSCNEKQIKPEPDIYRTLLKRFGLIPEECVFIDDRKDNVETAVSLGINGIVFRDFRDAASQLENLGVK